MVNANKKVKVSYPPFHMIVAVSNSFGIGKEGKIPWRIPEDVRFFKNVTCYFKDTHTIDRMSELKKKKLMIKKNEEIKTKISTDKKNIDEETCSNSSFDSNKENNEPEQLVKQQDVLKSVTPKEINTKTEIEKPELLDMTSNKSIKNNDSIYPKNVVIMGRNTWESIPKKFRPMPDRINIVLSRNKDYSNTLPEGVQCYNSLESCLEGLNTQEHGTVFVIGGAHLYREGINYEACKSIFLTKVYCDFECDTFFPEIPLDEFTVNNESQMVEIFSKSMENYKWINGKHTHKKTGINFEFLVFSRNDTLTTSLPTTKTTTTTTEEIPSLKIQLPIIESIR